MNATRTVSLGDCARLLEEWDELLASGALLQKRATLYNDVSAKCLGLCMQIEASNMLGRDASFTGALERDLAELLPLVPRDKLSNVEAAMKRFNK